MFYSHITFQENVNITLIFFFHIHLKYESIKPLHFKTEPHITNKYTIPIFHHIFFNILRDVHYKYFEMKLVIMRTCLNTVSAALKFLKRNSNIF